MVNMYLETATRGIRRGTGWYGYVLECFDSKGNVHTVQEFRKEENVRDSALLAKDVLPVTEEDRARREAAGISVRELRGSVRTEEEIPAEKTESHFPLPS